MPTCRVPGCGTKIATKKSGLCMRHYKQDRRGTLTMDTPKVGAPSGYGHYGVLDNDGAQVMCHECGTWKKALGGHINSAHDMTAREYKIRHGLPLGIALMSPDTRQTWVDNSTARVGSEAWARLESARDPVAASKARTELSFQSSGRETARDIERPMRALGKFGPKPPQE